MQVNFQTLQTFKLKKSPYKIFTLKSADIIHVFL